MCNIDNHLPEDNCDFPRPNDKGAFVGFENLVQCGDMSVCMWCGSCISCGSMGVNI